MMKTKTLLDTYRFPGHRPRATVTGIFGDPYARVIRLERGQKKQFADVAGRPLPVSMTVKYGLKAKEFG